MSNDFFKSRSAGNIPRAQPNLLETSKLSRLPKRRSTEFENVSFPTRCASVCVGCKTELNEYNQPLKYPKVCRKCLLIYNTIETELEEAAKTERRAAIQRMAGGVR